MSNLPINNDNIYTVGTHITAKEFPERKLLISGYKQRIYYCSVIGKSDNRQLAYFERELLAP